MTPEMSGTCGCDYLHRPTLLFTSFLKSTGTEQAAGSSLHSLPTEVHVQLLGKHALVYKFCEFSLIYIVL